MWRLFSAFICAGNDYFLLFPFTRSCLERAVWSISPVATRLFVPAANFLPGARLPGKENMGVVIRQRTVYDILQSKENINETQIWPHADAFTSEPFRGQLCWRLPDGYIHTYYAQMQLTVP